MHFLTFPNSQISWRTCCAGRPCISAAAGIKFSVCESERTERCAGAGGILCCRGADRSDAGADSCLQWQRDLAWYHAGGVALVDCGGRQPERRFDRRVATSYEQPAADDGCAPVPAGCELANDDLGVARLKVDISNGARRTCWAVADAAHYAGVLERDLCSVRRVVCGCGTDVRMRAGSVGAYGGKFSLSA